MATYDEAYDWDNLSDEDWNKKLDEKIDELMKTALETREVIRCI